MRTRVFAVLLAAVLAGALAGSAAAKPAPPSGSAACGTSKITWSPSVLWPPNHKLVDVKIVSDAAAFLVTGVASNEDGSETGSTANNEPDAMIKNPAGGGGKSNPAVVQLRAERNSKPKAGRTYTIGVTCGTAGGASLQVLVPHSQKKTS